MKPKSQLISLSFIIAACAIILCALSSCETVEKRDLLLASWVDDFLLPSYQDFEDKLQLLENKAVDLCDDPSESSLSSAQTAWSEARAPWKQTEIFKFGPYSKLPQQYGPKIDSWPTNINGIEDTIDGSSPLTVDTVGNFGFVRRGLPVIEYLLFQSDVDLVDEFTNSPRRCEYLLAAIGDAQNQAQGIHDAWDPAHGNYRRNLVEAGAEDTAFMNLQMALGEVVNRMAHTIENIRNDKLGRPVGTTSGGIPQPDKAESRFSGRSLQDIRDNLEGIERLYFGDMAGQPLGKNLGVNWYLLDRGRDFGPGMRSHLDEAYAAIDNITDPLTTAINTDTADIHQAIDVLGELQRFIQVDIINALSLSVSFNDTDGD